MASGSKYSIIIEALIKEKSIQKSIDEQQKTLLLILNNIQVSQEGMAKLKSQIETGLSNVKINIDADKTKDVGKKISENISAGIEKSGSTGKAISTNFEKIEIAIAKSNKQLELMSVQAPKAFAAERVQETVGVLKQYQTGLSDGTVSIQKFNGQMALTNKEFQIAKAGMQNIAHDGKSFVEMLDLAIKKIAIWALGTMVFYGTIQQLREMEQYVIDLNKAMTDIQIVNNMTSESISELSVQYNSLAKEMGVTTLEVAKGSVEWINFSSL